MPAAHDGARIRAGAVVLARRRPTVSLLTAERTALNFLQHLSGVATQTRRFVDAVEGTGVRIVDTRKTTPGWRALEKYAVRCGGGSNHRSSLGEHVLIKDNHIAAAGSLGRAVALARKEAPHVAKIEVEAGTLAEVRSACRARADVILLDNMSPALDPARRSRSSRAVRSSRSPAASAWTRFAPSPVQGVDVISVGALTHSAPAVDLSLTVRPG